MEHVERSLVEVYELAEANVVADLLDLPLSRDEMLSKLADFDLQQYFPVLLTEITVENSIISPGTRKRLDQVNVRCRGEVWRVHRKDGDWFLRSAEIPGFGVCRENDQPHEFNISDAIESKLRTDPFNLFEDRSESRRLRKKDFCFSFVVSLKLGERSLT